jgi:hypothetical protein
VGIVVAWAKRPVPETRSRSACPVAFIDPVDAGDEHRSVLSPRQAEGNEPSCHPMDEAETGPGIGVDSIGRAAHWRPPI